MNGSFPSALSGAGGDDSFLTKHSVTTQECGGDLFCIDAKEGERVVEEMRAFYNDKDVAHRFGFSTEWVRQDRFRRRHGQHHVLDFDPVMIGSKPRYRSEDIDALIARLKAQAPKPPRGENHP